MVSFQELMQFDKNAKPGDKDESGDKVKSGFKVEPGVKVEPGLQKVKKGGKPSSISLSLSTAVTKTSGHSVASETKAVRSKGVSKESSTIEKTFEEQLRKRETKTKMAKFVTPKLAKKSEKEEMLDQLNFFKKKQVKNKNNGGASKRSAVIKSKELKLSVNQDILEEETKLIMTRPDAPQDNQNELHKTLNRTNVIESGALVIKTKVNKSDGFESNVIGTNEAETHVIKENEAKTNAIDPEHSVTESNHNQSDKPSLNKTIFKCDKCDESFSYLKRFSDHQAKGTCDATFSCSHCNVRLKDAKNLKKHIKKIHERPQYQCADCAKVFQTEKAVTKHMQNFHLPNQCKLCKKFFKNANTRRSHFLNCKKKKNPEVGNIETIDHTLTEASTGVNNSNNNGLENVVEVSNKADEDAHLVVKYNKECSLCKKVYHSGSGFHKHMKTHRQAEVRDPVNDVLIVDDEGNPVENMVIVDEDGNENNMILQFDNL